MCSLLILSLLLVRTHDVVLKIKYERNHKYEGGFNRL